LIDGESDPGWVHGLALEPGRGIAAVETARGLLVHWANVEDDRVAGYRIVAPTEWNFHPCGALVKDLADAPAQSSEEAQQLAGLAIQSLDPCVRFELRLTRL
jgi:coenzyme F420-reducing hydrogenase alpha subunit